MRIGGHSIFLAALKRAEGSASPVLMFFSLSLPSDTLPQGLPLLPLSSLTLPPLLLLLTLSLSL